jgi:hypothetical protein
MRSLRKVVATIVAVAVTVLKLACTLLAVPTIVRVIAANLTRRTDHAAFPTADRVAVLKRVLSALRIAFPVAVIELPLILME